MNRKVKEVIYSKGNSRRLFHMVVFDQTALDEDLGLKGAERIVKQSFTIDFNGPVGKKGLRDTNGLNLEIVLPRLDHHS